MSFPAQLSRFAVVGAVATVFQYVLMAVLINHLGMPVLLASTCSYALSALLNYALNRCLVFHSQTRHTHALPRFAATVCVGLLLNATLMYAALNVLALHWLAAQVLVTLLVMVSNFLFSKYWVFQPGHVPAQR